MKVFDNCQRIAWLRGMGFSILKIQWLGFGDAAWAGRKLGDQVLEVVNELRILGIPFNMYGNFSANGSNLV